MEIIMIIGCIIVLLIVFDISFLLIVTTIFKILAFLSGVCVVFFAVMAVIAFLCRKKKATFIRLEESSQYGGHAIYRIEGEEYKNTFPTEMILEKFLYRKSEVNVRMLRTKKGQIIFDPVSLLVIKIGLPSFCIIVILLMFLLR